MKNEIAFSHFICMVSYQCMILLIYTGMRCINYNSHLSLPAALVNISEPSYRLFLFQSTASLVLLAKTWGAGWKREQNQSNQRLSSKSSSLCPVPPKFHVKLSSWTSMFPVPYDRKRCGNNYSTWVIKEINPERQTKKCLSCAEPH